jgi:hypothetical protein
MAPSRQMIRDRLQAAALPSSPFAFTFPGLGDGRPCCCCDQPIGGEVACLFVDNGGQPAAMHPDCFDAWHAVASELVATSICDCEMTTARHLQRDGHNTRFDINRRSRKIYDAARRFVRPL